MQPRDEDGDDCIRLLHKYYFGEETDYSGSIECSAACSRYSADSVQYTLWRVSLLLLARLHIIVW